MNKETEIAKDNILDYKNSLGKVGEDMNYSFCAVHKETCKRWLEFLERLYKEITENVIAVNQTYKSEKMIEKEMKDKEQTIKIYREAGI